MKALVTVAAFLLAGAAWAQTSKTQAVVVTNPSLTVKDANAGLYTHVGQKPSRVVNLQVVENFAYRVDPATGFLIDVGSRTPFRVPEGFLFVLTDITGSSVCTAGSVNSKALYQFFNNEDPRPKTVVPGVCSDSGSGYFESHFTTGLLFGTGSQIYIVGVTSGFADIQGYLVPAD